MMLTQIKRSSCSLQSCGLREKQRILSSRPYSAENLSDLLIFKRILAKILLHDEKVIADGN